MNKMMAYCGISCSDCPTFLATQNNDDAARQKVAKQWSQWFGMDLALNDINCDGCLNIGKKLFGHCQKCEIRKCAQSKKIDSCAYCSDYMCGTLQDFLSLLPTPDAKKNLEALRNKTL